ncbi:unnamed protein product [marine sediment metagenome]|uniref:Uncharacterized protein n=1 Tax=marine sediment metagenome TaxID=412755 RepID=X1G329_9ZZZZ
MDKKEEEQNIEENIKDIRKKMNTVREAVDGLLDAAEEAIKKLREL